MKTDEFETATYFNFLPLGTIVEVIYRFGTTEFYEVEWDFVKCLEYTYASSPCWYQVEPEDYEYRRVAITDFFWQDVDEVIEHGVRPLDG